MRAEADGPVAEQGAGIKMSGSETVIPEDRPLGQFPKRAVPIKPRRSTATAIE